MMDVVYCFDDHYARPTVVSARSLLRWTPHAKVHLLHQRASSTTLDWMKARLPENASFYDVGPSCWATANYKSHISHISKATNLRLCTPEVLPSSVTKALYLDGDTLVFADLSGYVASFPECPSGFAARKGGAMSSKTWGKGLFPKNAAPLVAGVLFMDLAKLRELGFGDACRRIMARVGPSNDQSVINLWCRGVFGQLPPELNMRAEEASGNSQPRVLHYEGAKGKPWEPQYRGPLKGLWKAHADSGEVPLERPLPPAVSPPASGSAAADVTPTIGFAFGIAPPEESETVNPQQVEHIEHTEQEVGPEFEQAWAIPDLHAAAAAGAKAGALAGARAGAVAGAEAGARAAAQTAGALEGSIDLDAMVLLGQSLLAQGLWGELPVLEEETEDTEQDTEQDTEDPSADPTAEATAEATADPTTEQTDDESTLQVNSFLLDGSVDLPVTPLDLGSED